MVHRQLGLWPMLCILYKLLVKDCDHPSKYLKSVSVKISRYTVIYHTSTVNFTTFEKSQLAVNLSVDDLNE